MWRGCDELGEVGGLGFGRLGLTEREGEMAKSCLSPQTSRLREETGIRGTQDSACLEEVKTGQQIRLLSQKTMVESWQCH